MLIKNFHDQVLNVKSAEQDTTYLLKGSKATSYTVSSCPLFTLSIANFYKSITYILQSSLPTIPISPDGSKQIPFDECGPQLTSPLNFIILKSHNLTTPSASHDIISFSLSLN